eukprot:358445-Chlamydomonas_euryale.AAC.33
MQSRAEVALSRSANSRPQLRGWPRCCERVHAGMAVDIYVDIAAGQACTIVATAYCNESEGTPGCRDTMLEAGCWSRTDQMPPGRSAAH